MSNEQSINEQKRDLREAIRVNEALLSEQRAHLSLHASRIEALEWRMEDIRQLIAKQNRNQQEAPQRIQAIERTLESQNRQLAALCEEQVVSRTKVTMKMLCERLAVLMSRPETVAEAKQLLKGINQGTDHQELWKKFGGGV